MYNKLLDGITLSNIIPCVTWTQSFIYIYIYMLNMNFYIIVSSSETLLIFSILWVADTKKIL